METNRGSSNSSGYHWSVLVLAILLVVGAFGFVAISVRNVFFGGVTAVQGNIPEVPDQQSLPEVNMDVLTAHLKNNPEYLKSVESDALAEYHRLNPPSAAYFSNGEMAIRLFLRETIGGDPYGECILQNADAYSHAAWVQGCRDPMILAICDVYNYGGFYPNNTKGAEENLSNIFALRDSNYPAICKFEAAVTGLSNLGGIEGSDEVRSKEGMDAVLSKTSNVLDAALNQCPGLLKGNIPMPLFSEKVTGLFDALQDCATWCLPKADDQIDSLLRQTPSAGVYVPLVHADFLIMWAWAARGSGWANTVTDQGWKDMAARLKLAQETLEAAYAQYPKEPGIPTLMIRVELGQGQGGDRMEMWFERAVADDPGWCSAYSSKMYYLQPKWYGSASDVLSFGEECINTGLWSSNVPLVCSEGITGLADYDEKTSQDERAWDLMKRACEGYLDHYPFSIRVRSTLVRYAAKAGKWDVVKEQMKILGGKWDFSVAGLDELDSIKKEMGG